MVIDHVIPRKVGGPTVLNNLALACYRCNDFKGARLDAPDPWSGERVSLFNPCAQDWHEHFEWTTEGLHITGRTPAGRATVEALHLNSDWLVRARRIWVSAGLFPPLE